MKVLSRDVVAFFQVPDWSGRRQNITLPKGTKVYDVRSVNYDFRDPIAGEPVWWFLAFTEDPEEQPGEGIGWYIYGALNLHHDATKWAEEIPE